MGKRAVWVLILGLVGVATVARAQVLRQLTHTKVETFSGIAMDDAGTFVVTASTEDDGANPNNDPRLVGWDLPSGTRGELVPFAIIRGDVSVSDDGQWIAFVSAADPVGQNADGSMEAFLVSRDGTVIRQLTDRPDFSAPNPRPVLSGSGNRVLFLDTGDPLGTNPSGLTQLFSIDATGTNLHQVTTVTDPATSFICDPYQYDGPRPYSVDDAGRRVVFSHDGDLTGANPDGHCQLYRVGSDGTILAQITTGSADKYWPALNGAGTRVAYYSSGSVHVVEYATAVSTELAAGFLPSITDDGQWVYYSEDCGVWKIPAAGGTPTEVVPSGPLYGCNEVVVSGGDAAVAFDGEGDVPGGNNPDGSSELWAADVDGSALQQLTRLDQYGPDYSDPDITPDGSWVLALDGLDAYRVRPDGSSFSRLTNDASVEHPSLASDGSTVVFESWLLTPPLTNPHIFSASDNGTDPVLLTPGLAFGPVLGKMSDVVVYMEPSTGTLLRLQLGGPGPTQIVADGLSYRKYPRVDYAGDWVVYDSPADPLGANPDHSREIFRVRTDGSELQQITSAPAGGASAFADVSADKNQIIFQSNTDPLGLNPDGNQEVFLYDATTGGTQQLTVTVGDYQRPGLMGVPRISGNGDYVFFESAQSFFEYPSALYRMELATGTIERCDGLPYQPPGFPYQTLRSNAGAAVDYSGDRVVFVGSMNGTGENGDLSGEVFLADFAAAPHLEVSSSQPTELSWEPDPRGARYDVIRGGLASLQPGPDGTVDLGPVVCLADDAPTTSFSDATIPAPGQGFFFLHRFSQGAPDGAGSWGQGTDDTERVAGFGACPG